MKGQVIAGELTRILIRQKSEQPIELGELLVTDNNGEKIVLQVHDLIYGSQISQENLELISGMHLESATDVDFIDKNVRNYILARAKPILSIRGDNVTLSKALPPFFSTVRALAKEDVAFLTKPDNSLYVGKLRSGRQTLDVDIYLPGKDVFSHHILIPATTGRGKSNLTSVMLWDCIGKNYCGLLVLDPHDEYYGRTGLGFKDHPEARNNVVYYTPNKPPAGTHTLKINLENLHPSHFEGSIEWTDAQHQAIYAAYNKFGKDWIHTLLTKEDVKEQGNEQSMSLFHEATLAVVKRKLMGLLGITPKDGELHCTSMFDTTSGTTTITDICNDLEQGKVVIVDTSSCAGAAEILVGSVIASELLNRYRNYKRMGTITEKPVISIVLEEAPRVLGNDVLKRGSNIFDTIAREGRKFKVGLVAITQLPSVIPRSILANMNTKIILGLEMKPERDAIIDSASQDMSDDSRTIASLDKGEAIITSNFTKFAIPIKIPLFKDVAQQTKKEAPERAYGGVQ